MAYTFETMIKNNVEENYINNLALNNVNNDDVFTALSLVPNPFLTSDDIKNTDVLSLLYNNFLENTEIPLTLPIFSLFSFISAFCIKNNITYKLPDSNDTYYLNTWTTVLAPSGSAKTFSTSQVSKLIPKDLNDKSIIEANILAPSGSAKFVEDLSKLPTTEGNYAWGFWLQDEIAQLFKNIELIGSPMSDMKGYLLEAYDHKKISRRTKKEEILTKNLVITTFFINTFESYANNISKESITDGLMRRFNLVYTQKDHRDFTDFAFYNINKIRTRELEEKFQEFFDNAITFENSYFTFSKSAKELYKKYFKNFWHNKYKSIMPDQENFYRTFFMESFKYAVFYHLILKKEGTVIGPDELAKGIKISLIFCESFKKFLDYKVSKKNIIKRSSQFEKYIDFLEKNPNVSFRDFCRKYSIKKDSAKQMLAILREKESEQLSLQLINKIDDFLK